VDQAEHIVSPVDASAQTRRLQRRFDFVDDTLLLGLSVLAVYHLALAVWMAASPHSFYTAIGPFGTYNRHFVRDVASFEAAFGFGFVVAVFQPSWRVPVLAIATVQFGLHAINHLVDIDRAHPAGIGYFDFFALLGSTLLLGLMLAAGRKRERKPPDPEEARP
jgi:hypothetical protein